MALATDWPLGRAANEAIALIETRVPAVRVAAVMPNERVDPAAGLVPVMDVGFTIPPEPGVFYVHPRSDKDWVHFALHSISLRANVVLSIFQGLTERADIIPLINPVPDDYPGGIVPAAAAV